MEHIHQAIANGLAESGVLGMSRPKVLIITGEGINCERETAAAFRLAGFDAEIRYINELVLQRLDLNQLSSSFSVLALPGGFSFGDDLGSGKVLALKIQYQLGWDLQTYAARGGLVIGICNGFQALIRMGVFGKEVSITNNANGKFLDTWVKVTPSGTHSPWLRGVGAMDLPIRHGEGRVIFGTERKSEVMSKMNRAGMMCLKYDGDPNGSEERLAGLCDASGRIFGLMPHPEAFVRWTAHPDWTQQPARANAPGQGLAIFENAMRAVQEAR